MINFNEKELAWIKMQMEDIIDIWENGSKEELKQYIRDIRGECLDIVFDFYGCRKDWLFFYCANTSEYYNSKLMDFCWNGLGMWYWQESFYESAEEVEVYIKDKTYCEIYEKLFKNLQGEEDTDAE